MNRSSNLERPTSPSGSAGVRAVYPARRLVLPRVVVALLASFGLAGCSQGSIEDLRAYAQQVSQRPGGKIEPLPPVKPYNVYTYASVDEKDPFQPFFQQKQAEAQAEEQDSGIRPDFNRNKEELEQFPLDTLKMVGTLESEQELWAILLTADGTVHRVQVGNYIGQNHGKIVNIQEDRIDLVEIARDARGRWQERPASVALDEEG